jgi:uncharacterized protein (DUF427 family)
VFEYKGRARHWSAHIGGQVHVDVAWSYPDPVPAVAAIAGHLAFDAPTVTITVDGLPQQRPIHQPGWLSPGLPPPAP